MKITVNMPQMAANGLSENWLFKHCGDLHWDALCASLDIRSSELEDDSVSSASDLASVVSESISDELVDALQVIRREWLFDCLPANLTPPNITI